MNYKIALNIIKHDMNSSQLIDAALDSTPFTQPPKSRKKLGEGTYSEVVSCDGVAIKIFKEAGDSAAIQEICILRYLSHNNIIRINSIIINANDEIHMYMNLYFTDISNSSWRRFTAGNMLIYTMTQIAHNIANGLSYMHSHKVIHGDIKPQNILYDIKTKNAIICDYNSAIYNPPPYIGCRIQTCVYRAPEVNFDKKVGRFSYKIDVYSLGCILFELFTARLFTNIVNNDSTIGACSSFGYPQYCENIERSRRYDFLKTMTFSIARAKIIGRIEETEWNDINFNSVDVTPPQNFKHFLNSYLDVMTKTLMPYHQARYDSTQALNEIQELFKYFDFERPPPINYTPNLPLSLMPHSEEIIKSSLKEHITPLNTITNNHHELECGKKRVICKNSIFELLPDDTVRWIRMIELNFYMELKRSKIVGSLEELETIAAAIYLIYCITDNRDNIMNIYEERTQLYDIQIDKNIIKKRAYEILRTLDYKAIL